MDFCCGIISICGCEPYPTDSFVYKNLKEPELEVIRYTEKTYEASPRMFDDDPELVYGLEEDSEEFVSFSDEEFDSESSSIQNFYKLRAKYLERDRLFVDHQFPASRESIGYSNKLSLNLKWKRPFEICEDPQFIIKPATRFDVMQGKLGDCWLLAILSDLTQNPIHFNHMVPGDQSFGKGYAGIFHFRIWQCHQGWVEVIIDDRLPTHNGKLVYSHSPVKNEFWCALMEKAFAKLKGSYEALNGGDPLEAMKDCNCQSIKKFKLKEEKYKGEKFFNILRQAYKKSYMMTCYIKIESNKDYYRRELRKKGLIPNHTYSITAVVRVKIGDTYAYEKALLFRIRNPWGNDVEWNGRWSDNSKDWQLISNRRKKELGLTFEADGEFWMSFEDFMENFTTVEICHFEPDFFDNERI